jgi:bloom syndrome protein
MQVMNAALSGRDVYVLMPTGGGKSRCYQIPAVVAGGVSVVITPLVSLLKDQLLHLAEANIFAAAFTASQSWEEQRVIYDALKSEDPHYRILFLTPEKVRFGHICNCSCN